MGSTDGQTGDEHCRFGMGKRSIVLMFPLPEEDKIHMNCIYEPKEVILGESRRYVEGAVDTRSIRKIS